MGHAYFVLASLAKQFTDTAQFRQKPNEIERVLCKSYFKLFSSAEEPQCLY